MRWMLYLMLFVAGCGPIYPVSPEVIEIQKTDMDRHWAAQWPQLTIRVVNIALEPQDVQDGIETGIHYLRTATGHEIVLENIEAEKVPNDRDPIVLVKWAQDLRLTNNGPFVIVIYTDVIGDGFTWGVTYRSATGHPIWIVVCTRREPIPMLSIEKFFHNVFIHEIGHVYGVPWREGHKIKKDPSHCTHSGCIMAGASTINFGKITRVLLHRWNLGFCGDCLEELDWMARLRNHTIGVDYYDF